MKIKVTTNIGFSYIPGFKLIAVKRFELLLRNCVFEQMDRQTDGQMDGLTDIAKIQPSCDGHIKTDDRK